MKEYNLFYPHKANVFGRILESACLCVCQFVFVSVRISLFVQIISFCQSANRVIKSHLVTALVCSVVKGLKVCSANASTITRRQILDSSKFTDFADDNLKFEESGRKLFKPVENTVGKGEIAITSNFSFSHSVFERLVSQGRQQVSLCGNGLKIHKSEMVWF